VPDEDHLGQVLGLEHAEDVGDVRLEVDIGRGKMSALARPVCVGV